MKKLLLTAFALSTFMVASAQKQVTVSYVPLDGESVSAMPIKSYTPSGETPTQKRKLKLYPDITYQEITGIGGCFNEIGGEALAALSQEDQHQLLNALFNQETGIAMSYCRASIGASDFGIDAYSFSEVADDYDMQHFSLEREKKYMLPYIQKAVAVNPDLKLFGSPWSPPAWMKHSGLMDQGNQNRETNMLKDDPRIYEAYALYFLKYVEGYKEAGVDVHCINIQNEQDANTGYPSCDMPVEQMAEFVSKYMRPLFVKHGIETEIWAGTFRTYGELEGLRLAASPQYSRSFDGIGVQYTTANYLADMVRLAPNMKFMHTESDCHNGDNSLEQAKGRFEEVARYINSGCQNFAYWNIILNETGKSGWDWKQNSLVTIDRESKSVTYNPDYAVMALMSRYIRTQSVRIASFYLEPTITLANKDGYTIIMQNNQDKVMVYECDIDGEVFDFEVPANSLCAVEVSK